MLTEQVLLQLIVNHLALLLASVLSDELATAGCISNGQLYCISQLEAATVADCNARLNHDQVDNFRISINLKVALLCNGDESLQQCIAGDPKLGKFEISIVKTVVTKLVTAVSDFDTRKRLETLCVTHRHYERLHAVIVLQSDASCKNDGVRGLDTQITWPELGSFDRWGVNHELVSIGIKSGSCLNTGHI